MADYETIIQDILNSNGTTLEKIEALKQQVSPYAKESELKETLNKIISEDTDYIRRYLKNTSNIVWQKDYYIDKVERFTYTNYFNNDSGYLPYRNTSILLQIDDYSLFSANHNYFTDVFIDGKKLEKSKYTIINSSKEEYQRFRSGAKRLFIIKDFVTDGCLVSVVVKKQRKIYLNNGEKTFYKNFKITNVSQLTYRATKSELGDLNNNLDNLLLYKKGIEDYGYLSLKRDCYSFELEGENIILKILEIPQINDNYLIINRLQNVEVTYINKSEVTEEEYIERYAIMNLDFVANQIRVEGSYLPIPVRNQDEIEIYVDGNRLINGYDFTFINDDRTKNQYIHFGGILKQNSEIIMRNKNFSSEYGFFRQFDDMKKDGIKDLSEYNIPISEDYIEVYVGRKRVARKDKRSIINRLIKIDNQDILEKLDIYPEIEYGVVENQLLNLYRTDTNKTVISQIGNLFPDLLISNWKENNELRPNDGLTTLEDIFIGRIIRIELIADSSVVTEGKAPTFRVIGYYSNDTEIAMDVTKYSKISSFDKYKIGRQIITATYVQGNEELTAELECEVVVKEILELTILTNSNFYVIGDNIKSSVKVLAKFEDNSEKLVTDLCTIDATDCAEEIGYESIKVEFNYNGRTLFAEKTVLVSDTSQRKIIKLEVILDNYIRNSDPQIVGSNISSMTIFATYNNYLIQEINSECADVNIINEDGSFTLIYNIKEFVIEDITKPINLDIKIFPSINKLVPIEFLSYDENDNEVISDHIEKQIIILEDKIDEENRYLVFNDLVAKIDETYIGSINRDYIYYRIRDLDNNIFSLGPVRIDDEAICLNNNFKEYIILEFLDINYITLNQVLFKVKNVNDYRKIDNGKLEGSPTKGFKAVINKFTFGRFLKDIDLENIHLLDKDYNVIAKFNDNSFNKIVDTASETDTLIYLDFNNFATLNGNIFNIVEFLKDKNEETKLYLDIANCDKLVDLALPQYKLIQMDFLKENDIYFDRTSDDYYLTIIPELDFNIAYEHEYEVRPNNTSIIKNEISDKIKLPLQADTSNEIYLTKNRYGLNRYYFESELDNIIHYIDIYIGFINDRVRVLKINDTEFTDLEYDSINIKYI